MLPKNFDYYSPKDVEEALELLSKSGDSKLLAGGQSLIPMMKLRLASPGTIIDLSRVKGLSGISHSRASVKIGSMERIAELAASKEIASSLPALHDASLSIADVQVRDMGTIGGNVANADPSNDMPVVVLAYNAKMHVLSKKGPRIEDADSFFTGPYSTKVNADEILTAIEFPISAARHGSAYSRLERRVGDYALAACAAYVELDSSGKCSNARISVSGISGSALRLPEAEAELVGKLPSKAAISAASDKARQFANIEDSYYASAEIKRLATMHVVGESLEAAFKRAKK